MKHLVVKIVQTLYPEIHDFTDIVHYKVHSSKKAMVKTLMNLETSEIISLYDKVIHNKIT